MKVTKSLLEKFSRGACNEEELAAISAWLQDGTWPGAAEDAAIREAIWHRINRRTSNKSRLVYYSWWKVAAAFLLLAGSAWLLYRALGRAPAVEAVYATALGERRKITLPDSSVVFLYPASTLRLPADYGIRERMMQLSGQATFEVAGDERRPFTVTSGKVAIRALGTSFTVTGDSAAAAVSVALNYGKVLVFGQGQARADSTYLRPGESVVYHYNGTSAPGRAVKAENRQQVLFFHRAGLDEVVTKLEHYYNIKVTGTDLLQGAQWQVSGEFAGEPLDVVMGSIAFTCNITYEIRHDTLMIAPPDR